MMNPEPYTPPRFPRSPPLTPESGAAGAAEEDIPNALVFWEEDLGTIELAARARRRLSSESSESAAPRMRTGRPWRDAYPAPPTYPSPAASHRGLAGRRRYSYFACLRDDP